MRKYLLILTVIFLSVLFLPDKVNAASNHFTFTSTTPSGPKYYTPYFYTIPNLPTTLNYQGLKGSITLSSSVSGDHLAGPAPFLVQLAYYPADKCPATGTPPIDPVTKKYIIPPWTENVQSFLVSITFPGSITLPIDFTLPYKYPISNSCMTVFYNGGEHIAGTPLTISADLTLKYDTDPAPDIKPTKFIDLGFEYCIFSFASGCSARSTSIAPNEALAIYHPIGFNITAKAINGDISYGSLEDSFVPTGIWTATSEFYYVPSCTLPPNPQSAASAFYYGPGTAYFNPPAGAVPIFKNTSSFTGRDRVQLPVYNEGLDLKINKGDCILELMKFNGNGGMHNETQLKIESIPTTPPQGDLNADGIVDTNDFNIFKSDFGKTGTAGFIASDINKDGKVDLFDYNILVSNFTKPKPIATPPPTTNSVPAYYLDGISSTGLASGWAADKNTIYPVQVKLYIDNNSYIGSTYSWGARPDVFASLGYGLNSNWNFQISSKFLNDGIQHKLYVSAVDVLPDGSLGATTAQFPAAGMLIPK